MEICILILFIALNYTKINLITKSLCIFCTNSLPIIVHTPATTHYSKLRNVTTVSAMNIVAHSQALLYNHIQIPDGKLLQCNSVWRSWRITTTYYVF